MIKISARNMDIYQRRLNGETLQSISDRYQITKGRVRQISLKVDYMIHNQWLIAGIPIKVINSLAAVNLSVEEAKAMDIKELMEIKGVGPTYAMLIKMTDSVA